LGSIPKFPALKNHRKRCDIVHDFNLRNGVYKKWDLSGWGLPRPNLEASYLSLNKYDKVQPCFDRPAMATAKKFMYTMFGRFVEGWRPISFDEAVGQLESSSSPGYPWSEKYATNELLLRHDLSTLRASVDNIFSEPIIWKNSLKEEIRPMEKILSNKIRTFTASPCHFTVYSTQFCWDFNNRFYDSHGKTWSAVGLDPYYQGWDYVYRRLKKFERAYELDVSEFDSSLFRHILFSIAEFRLDTVDPLHKEEALVALPFIYTNIVNSVIITADGNVVIKSTGNPSGQTNTIVDNTLALFMLLSYVWVLKIDKPYSEFVTNVSAWLCGDDNSMSVSDQYKHFDARLVQETLACLGVKVTSPSLDPRPVEQITFLSRQFDHFYKGICVPYMPPEKSITSLLFSEDPNDPARLLQRIGGFINIAWPDRDFTAYLRQLANEIVHTYGDLLMDDPEWHIGLSSILTPGQVQHLFVGVPALQGGSAVKILCPPKVVLLDMDKQANKAGVVVTLKPDGQVKAAKKGRKRGARRDQKHTVTVKENRKGDVTLKVGPTNAMAQGRAVGRAQNRAHMKKIAPRGLTRAAKECLEAITLPQNSPPFRLYSGYNDTPSGAANPFEQEPIVYGTEAETFIFAFRSALRNAVRGIPLDAGDFTAYAGYEQKSIERGAGWCNINPRALAAGSKYVTNFVPTTGTAAFTRPHGDWLYPGRLGESDPFRGFWVNADDIIVVCSDGALADAYQSRLMVLDGQEWNEYSVKPFDANFSSQYTASFTGLNTIGGYMAVQVQNITPGAPTGLLPKIWVTIISGVGNINFQYPATGVTTVIPVNNDFVAGHRPVKDLNNRFKIVDDIKIFGVSILYTNTSAFTSNQGQVAMAQIPGMLAWTNNYTFDSIASMNAARSKYQPVTNGSYVFLKPGDSKDFSYLSEYEVSSVATERIAGSSGPDGFEDGAFLIYPESDYLATILAQDPTVQRSGLCSIANSLQYITNDNWTEVQLPRYDLSTVEPSLKALRTITQFHENEFHISDVFNWLKDAASTVVQGVMDYGPMVLKGAAMVAPFLL